MSLSDERLIIKSNWRNVTYHLKLTLFLKLAVSRRRYWGSMSMMKLIRANKNACHLKRSKTRSGRLTSREYRHAWPFAEYAFERRHHRRIFCHYISESRCWLPSSRRPNLYVTTRKCVCSLSLLKLIIRNSQARVSCMMAAEALCHVAAMMAAKRPIEASENELSPARPCMRMLRR